ncbi:MAG: hypothetical protein IT449_00230 [Phycisphaerales bacterium]|nr:hypothetical protein [Phycisphaerales bacterium]
MTGMRWTVRRVLTVGLSLVSSCTAPAPPGDNSNANDNNSGAPSDRVGSGTARLSGVIYSADSEVNIPLAGAVLVLGDAVGVAKANGAFDLFGVPSGLQPLLIDGSRILAGDGQYAQFAAHLSVIEGEQRLLDEPIYLPFILNGEKVTVVPEAETPLTSGGGGLLRIPPGAARDDADLYESWLALLDVGVDRAPLPIPENLTESALALLTLQPLGVEFPAPLPLRAPVGGGANAGPYAALMEMDFATGTWIDAGVMRRAGDRLETLSGGLRRSGWFMLSRDLHVRVFSSCAATESGGCLRHWASVQSSLARLEGGSVAGARATLERLALTLLDHERSVAGANALLENTVEDFRIVNANLAELAATYRRSADLDALLESVSRVNESCGGEDACDATDSDINLEIERLSRLANQVSVNFNQNAPRLQRIAQAAEALQEFYELIEPLDDGTLAGFETGVNEFLSAFADFSPLESPADANDALLALLEDAGAQVGVALSLLREPASSTDGASIDVLELASPSGFTAVAAPDEGVAGFRPRSSSGESFIWSFEAATGKCSLPIRLENFLATPSPPLELTLDRRIQPGELFAGSPAAASITPETPVGSWTFSAPSRQGVEVSFAGDSSLLVGIALRDGIPLAALPAGFHVSNLPQGGPYRLQVLGTDVSESAAIDYRIQVDPDETLFSFGEPVRGSFDLFRRAEVIFFEGQAGEGLTVDLRCCGVSGGELAYGVFDPSGRELQGAGQPGAQGNLGATFFELLETGLHRVILTPGEGVFTNYEIVLTSLPPRAPIDYVPGTDVTLDFEATGRGILLHFTGEQGKVADFQGLSAEGLDRLVLHVETQEGEIVVDQAVVYFDGTSFSHVRFALPADDDYLMTLSSGALGQPTSGRATVRMDYVSAPSDP